MAPGAGASRKCGRESHPTAPRTRTGRSLSEFPLSSSKPSRAAGPSQVDWCDPGAIALRNKESGGPAALAIYLHTIAGSAKQRLPAIARDALLKIEFEHRSDLGGSRGIDPQEDRNFILR